MNLLEIIVRLKNEAKGELGDLEDELKGIETAAGDGGDALVSLERELKGVDTATTGAAGGLGGLEGDLRGVGDVADSAAGDLRNLENDLRGVDSSANATEGELAGLEGELKDVDNTAGKTGDQLDKLEGDLKDVDSASGKAGGSLGGLSSLMSPLNIGIGTVVAGATALAVGLWKSVEAAAESEVIQTQLEAVLTSTGGAAGLTADEVNTLTSELETLNAIDGEVILSGENMLLTFTQIGEEVFPRVTQTALDMTSAMNGGVVTQEALKGTAIQLGKAINDPTVGMSALTKVGVTFTDQQKEQIKTMQESGDLMGAQTVILDELAKEFGGSAQANALTFTGRMEALNIVIGNFTEDVGGIFIDQLTEAADDALPAITEAGEDLIPIIEDLAEDLPELVEGVTDLIGVLPEAVQLANDVGDAWERWAPILRVTQDPLSTVEYFMDLLGFTTEETTETLENQAMGFGGLTTEVYETIAAESELTTTQEDLTAATEAATIAGWSYAEQERLLAGDVTEAGLAYELTAVFTDDYTAAKGRSEAASLALALAEEELALKTGEYFNQSVTATGQTQTFEDQLYGMVGAAGTSAETLAALSVELGILTPAEAAAHLEAAILTTNIGLLAEAIATGTFEAGLADEALEILTGGERDTAAEAMILAERMNTVEGEIHAVGFEAHQTAQELHNIPEDIDVSIHTEYTSSGTPPPGSGGNWQPTQEQHGGPVHAGLPYWVGEVGPEPFFPAVDGRILSNLEARQALQAGAATGGGVGARITFYGAQLSFPNITSGTDAGALLAALEELSF